MGTHNGLPHNFAFTHTPRFTHIYTSSHSILSFTLFYPDLSRLILFEIQNHLSCPLFKLFILTVAFHYFRVSTFHNMVYRNKNLQHHFLVRAQRMDFPTTLSRLTLLHLYRLLTCPDFFGSLECH